MRRVASSGTESAADRHAGVVEGRSVTRLRVDVVGGSSGAIAAGQRAVQMFHADVRADMGSEAREIRGL